MENSTKASRAVTYRRIGLIALPVVLSNALIPLQGAIDTAIIGNLGDAVYLAAVAMAAAAIGLILQVFNFLQFGAGALGAQALGAQDHRRVINVLARALILAVGIGVALIAVQAPLIAMAMKIFEGSERAESLAEVYLSIRIWAAPGELAIFALSGWFAGQELTRRLFEMQAATAIANIVLNVFFVIGLGMDVDGVALGTLIAVYLGVALGLWRARARMKVLMPDWRPSIGRLLNRPELILLMRLNRDIFIRTVLVAAAFTWMTRLGSQHGDIVLAANGILFQIFSVTTYGLDGFAMAVESLVGQAVGARDRAFLRRSVIVTTICAVILSTLLALLLFVSSGPLIALFTNVPEVREATASFFLWAALCPLAGVLAFQMDGIFVGATGGVAMRNGMIVSAGIYFAISGWLANSWGNHGVWAGVWALLILRGVTLLAQYPAMERRVMRE
ncbi:MAG: MATE family efflux transporter [Pseudomonadota bacterium]